MGLSKQYELSERLLKLEGELDLANGEVEKVRAMNRREIRTLEAERDRIREAGDRLVKEGYGLYAQLLDEGSPADAEGMKAWTDAVAAHYAASPSLTPDAEEGNG